MRMSPTVMTSRTTLRCDAKRYLVREHTKCAGRVNCADGHKLAIDFISKREERRVANTVRKNRANEDVADGNDFATTLRCDAKRYLLREHTKCAGRVSCADGHKLAIDFVSKREERCIANTVRKTRRIRISPTV